MNPAEFKVRRATVEDVPELGPLLASTVLSSAHLEKRFTEFQLAEGPDGRLVGAMGLQVAGKQAKIHSEAYPDFALVDTLRPLLWERMQNLAQTQGLTRLWTQETAPFWKQAGFEPATQEQRNKLPAAFGSTKGEWLTLKLKDDIDALISVDDEFEAFAAAQRVEREKMMAHARTLKWVAAVVAGTLFLFTIYWLFYYLARHKTG